MKREEMPAEQAGEEAASVSVERLGDFSSN
jgi:hypothetical protein